MQKGHKLEFACQGCNTPIMFSVFHLDTSNHIVTCSTCSKKYAFNDETLLRQLSKFEKLCSQIHESEEILGDSSVGIDIGDHHVEVPFKLLLTRLNSSLDLMIGNQPCKILFRLEPGEDTA